MKIKRTINEAPEDTTSTTDTTEKDTSQTQDATDQGMTSAKVRGDAATDSAVNNAHVSVNDLHQLYNRVQMQGVKVHELTGKITQKGDFTSGMKVALKKAIHPIKSLKGQVDDIKDNDKAKLELSAEINDMAFALAFSDNITDDITKVVPKPKTDLKEFRRKLGDSIYASFIDRYLKWDQVRHSNKFIRAMQNYKVDQMPRKSIIDLYNEYAANHITDAMLENGTGDIRDLMADLKDRNDRETERNNNMTSEEATEQILALIKRFKLDPDFIAKQSKADRDAELKANKTTAKPNTQTSNKAK